MRQRGARRSIAIFSASSTSTLDRLALIDQPTTVREYRSSVEAKYSQPSSVQMLAELVGIIYQERTCCSFLRFHLTAEPGTGPVIFEVTGPPGTREMLRAL